MSATSTRMRASSFVAAMMLTIASRAMGAPAPTELDRANARELFNQGIDLREANDHKGALAKFQAADAIVSTPKTRLELGREQMLLGMLVEARLSMLSVANLTVEASAESKYTEVRVEAAKLADELKTKIPTLRVRLDKTPSGSAPSVFVGETLVPTAALAEPRLVNPGTHVVSVKVGSGTVQKQEVTVKEGDAREIVFDLSTVEVVKPPPPHVDEPSHGATPPHEEAPPSGWGIQKTVGVALLGVGVLGLGGATYFGLSAKSANADSKAAGLCDGNDRCTPEGVSARDRAISRANLATVFVIAGVAAVGAGAVLWLTAPSRVSASGTKKTNLAIGIAPTGFFLAGGF